MGRGEKADLRGPIGHRHPPHGPRLTPGTRVRAAGRRGGVSAARAVSRAYLAGTPPAPPLQGGRRRGGLAAGSGLGGGGPPAGLPDQVGAGWRRRRWAPFQRCCVRAGRLPRVRLGRADCWRGRRTGRRVAFGQWPGRGPETRSDRPQITAPPPRPGLWRDSWYLGAGWQPARRPGFRDPPSPSITLLVGPLSLRSELFSPARKRASR